MLVFYLEKSLKIVLGSMFLLSVPNINDIRTKMNVELCLKPVTTTGIGYKNKNFQLSKGRHKRAK